MRGRQDDAKQKEDNREPLLEVYNRYIQLALLDLFIFFCKNYVLLLENVLYMFFSSVCIETFRTSTGKKMFIMQYFTQNARNWLD